MTCILCGIYRREYVVLLNLINCRYRILIFVGEIGYFMDHAIKLRSTRSALTGRPGASAHECDAARRLGLGALCAARALEHDPCHNELFAGLILSEAGCQRCAWLPTLRSAAGRGHA